MNKSNRFLFALFAAAALNGVTTAADVGVSVSVSQPGFYGRIDVGNAPQPALIYQQPVVIEQRTVVVPRQPIYLRVRPGHEKDWGKHCKHYAACGQPVYFVQDTWYRDVYAHRNQSESRGRDDRRDNGRHGNKKMKKNHGGD